VLDDRFRQCRGDSRFERLYDDCRWAEGPVYVPAGRYVVWSDIPNERMLRWDEMSGNVGLFRSPSGFSNGNTLDREGRLVTCEHGNRRVSRTEHDGTISVLADRFDGKQLNSPNDVVVRSDGSVWFTDPAYGIDSDYEGYKGEIETGGCHVYRVGTDGVLTRVADDFNRPNGIAFSPDESLLYISDSEEGTLRVFTVDGDKLSGGELFAECGNGIFDGFRLDTQGRIWTSAADGVHIYHPDGTLLGKLLVPETVSNLTWGGPKRNRLFITATTSVYSLYTTANGAPEAYGPRV